MTKELGKVDPSGNYGLGQAEADKARKWAADRKTAREILGLPPVRFTREAEWCAELDRKYPHGFKAGFDPGQVSVTSVTSSVTSSVTPEPTSVTPAETPTERKKRLTRERVARHRKQGRKR